MAKGDIVKGWKARLLIGYTPGEGNMESIGEAESVSFDIDVAIDDYFAIGKIFPAAIAEGAQSVSGTIEKAWVDGSMLALIYGGDPDSPVGLPEFQIYAYPDETNPVCHIYAWKCKAESASIDIPADGFITESIDFRAEYFTYVGGTLGE